MDVIIAKVELNGRGGYNDTRLRLWGWVASSHSAVYQDESWTPVLTCPS